MKVLIVEDEQSLLKLLSYHMEKKGWKVITASEGNEAVEKLVDKPDVVLLDILLPGIDGLEVLATIREKYTNEELPAIMVSNFSDISYIERANKLGIFNYLVKGDTEIETIISETEKAVSKSK